jgi:hypothetical protein
MVVADAPQVANAFLNQIIELGYHFRLFNGLIRHDSSALEIINRIWWDSLR